MLVQKAQELFSFLAKQIEEYLELHDYEDCYHCFVLVDKDTIIDCYS
jgi:hypothetical protein